jgi:hypothetical protein
MAIREAVITVASMIGAVSGSSKVDSLRLIHGACSERKGTFKFSLPVKN